MKARHIIVLSLAAAAVFSCARERVEKEGNHGAPRISFATRIETRGTILDGAPGLAARGGFTVWAYGHSPKWDVAATVKAPLTGLDGVPVASSDNGDTWSYGTPIAWPTSGYVSFFACGTTTAATYNGTDGNGVPQISFSVAPTIADQTDFVVANAIYDQAGMSYSDGNAVHLNFEHALSRITFSGMLADDDTRTIRVKQIVLDGL